MRRNSGQAIIAVVVLFALVIFMSLIYFMILVAGGERGQSQFMQDVRPQIEYKIGEVKKRSVVTTTMDDYLWRADGVPKGKYDNKVARQVLSYYASTPPPDEDSASDDSIYIGGRKIGTDEVRSDLESYFRYKMEKHWDFGTRPVSYQLEVQGGQQENMIVKTQDYQPKAGQSGHGYTVATVNNMASGDSIRLFLWTSGSNSVWGLQ